MTPVKTTSSPKKSPRRTKLLSHGMDVERVSLESRKQASCVLEVLAGVRTPEQAASALEISVPTYYHLEMRALRGLVHGCTPEPPGRKQALLRQVREAEARCAEVERQVQRYRALLRSAQRAAGVLAEVVDEPKAKRRVGTAADSSATRSRRPRKPRVRALRAIAALDTASAGDRAIATVAGAGAGDAKTQVVAVESSS